ncbi:SAE2-domain-containing protein [Whalleya microplaca]|nr:SAE2-domain-containing protein [Whalleya microplaca]
MEDWFKEFGRPALLDALAGVCDRLDDDFNAGIKLYVQENARLTTEIEALRSKVSEIDHLKDENRSLKKEIQSLTNKNRKYGSTEDQPKLHDGGRTPLAPRSVNQVSITEPPTKSTKPSHLHVDRLKSSEREKEYLRAEGNYAKLQGKYSELQDAHTELHQRLRDKTKAYKQWMDHANKLNEQCQNRSRKIKKLEAKLAATAVSSPANLSFSSTAPDEQHIHPSKHRGSDVADELRLARATPILRESPLKWPPTSISNTDSRPTTGTSSTAPAPIGDLSRTSRTESSTPSSETHDNTNDAEVPLLPPLPEDRDGTADLVVVKNEPSSDAPVMVSERCLRKRKQDDRIERTPALTRIKSEYDSDALVTDERRHFAPHESIDFDAEGSRVDTPRKRTRLNLELEVMPLAYTVEASRSEAGGTRAMKRGGSAMAVTTRQDDSPTRSPAEGDPISAPDRRHTDTASPDLQPRRSSALHPLSRNVLLPPRTETNPMAKRKDSSSMQDAIDSLAEDGGEHHASTASEKKRPKARRALHNLLNEPSSEREVISLSTRAHQENTPTAKPFQFQIPQRRELPFGKDGPKKTNKVPRAPDTPAVSNNKRISNPRRASDAATTRGGGAGDTTPLRERTKSRLRLDDFKINPGANEGYGYAYTDVVRNKDQRASLSGCVNESCCGESFRALARSMRSATGPVDFQVLLENYLGDEAWKLSTMSPPEKERLWLEAKTRELSDSHGKHRHRYQRMASPPGFWRTDFPSTQEGERDREEAARMERQIVEERYREAMRPGGRWLFKDE